MGAVENDVHTFICVLSELKRRITLKNQKGIERYKIRNVIQSH